MYLKDYRLYSVYRGMIERCYYVNVSNYKNYGGRGITISDEWLESFHNFNNDMFPTFQEGLSIDRIDNNKGYSKDNCKWSNKKEQNRNTRDNILYEYKGRMITLIEIYESENVKIPFRTFQERFKKTKDLEYSKIENINYKIENANKYSYNGGMYLISELVEMTKISKSTISLWIKKHGTFDNYDKDYNLKHKKGISYYLYQGKKLTLTELSKILNISRTTLNIKLKSNNILMDSIFLIE